MFGHLPNVPWPFAIVMDGTIVFNTLYSDKKKKKKKHFIFILVFGPLGKQKIFVQF